MLQADVNIHWSADSLHLLQDHGLVVDIETEETT